jgi:hypothetical protein
VKKSLAPPRLVLSLDPYAPNAHDPYKGMGREAQSQFEIVVRTGAHKEAGTDATVFIRIFGTERNTGSIKLESHAPITDR